MALYTRESYQRACEEMVDRNQRKAAKFIHVYNILKPLMKEGLRIRFAKSRSNRDADFYCREVITFEEVEACSYDQLVGHEFESAYTVNWRRAGYQTPEYFEDTERYYRGLGLSFYAAVKVPYKAFNIFSRSVWINPELNKKKIPVAASNGSDTISEVEIAGEWHTMKDLIKAQPPINIDLVEYKLEETIEPAVEQYLRNIEETKKRLLGP